MSDNSLGNRLNWTRIEALLALAISKALRGGAGVGQGAPLPANLAVRIDPINGTDTAQADGSLANPFKTAGYFYKRLQYLYGSSPLGPNLGATIGPTGAVQPAITLATPTMTVTYASTVPAGDVVGLPGNVSGPAGGQVVFFGPPLTVTDSGVLTVTQVLNRTTNPGRLWRINVAGKAWTPQTIILDNTANTLTWIEADLGGGTAQTDQWFTPLTATAITAATVPTMTAPGNDPYQALSFGQATLGTGTIKATQVGILLGATQNFAVTFSRFAFQDAPGVQGSRGSSDGFAQVNFVECSFRAPFEPGQSCNLLNCSMGGDISVFDNDHRIVGGQVLAGWNNDSGNAVYDGDILAVNTPPIIGGGSPTFGLVSKVGGGVSNLIVNDTLAISPEFYGTGLFWEATHSLIGVQVAANATLGLSSSLTANLNVHGSFLSADIGIGNAVYTIATVTGEGADSIRDQQVGGYVGLPTPTLVYPREVVVGGGGYNSGGTLQLAIYTTSPTVPASPNGVLTSVAGSQFMRTDVGAAAGSRVYICQGGNAWTAIAGV